MKGNLKRWERHNNVANQVPNIKVHLDPEKFLISLSVGLSDDINILYNNT
uniref:Uncharacterized protein n=1 Tax=Kalanchoe fedtschenkoi TaxID=63787 RepID=A0A7N0VB66_KALFE